jgi:hypothetical protein
MLTVKDQYELLVESLETEIDLVETEIDLVDFETEEIEETKSTQISEYRRMMGYSK